MSVNPFFKGVAVGLGLSILLWGIIILALAGVTL